MQPRERNAFVFLCVLTALLLGPLVPAYVWTKPQPRAVSIHVKVMLIKIDDALLDSVGVNYDPTAADVGTQ